MKKQVSHGLLFNVNYTYSHAIDNGSTWHSGATTANGAAAGEGYTTDQTLPGLDRGNSLFDVRQRLVFNYVWELPGKNLHGFVGAVLGGWSYNGIWAFQSGAHWEPYIGISPASRSPTQGSQLPAQESSFDPAHCTNQGGDYNLDHGNNDRPNSTLSTLPAEPNAVGKRMGSRAGRFNILRINTVPVVPATWVAIRSWDQAPCCRHDPGQDIQIHLNG